MTTPDTSSRAHIIAQALPYMQRYDDKTVVVKYGGHAMGDRAFRDQRPQDQYPGQGKSRGDQ